jgi:tetratricopeptide (TPR) repeat protein
LTDRSYSGSKIGGVHQRTLIREWNNIGYELSGQGRHAEALEAFNKVLATENSDVNALAGKGSDFIVFKYICIILTRILAFISLQLKNFEVALECCERILDLGESTSTIFALRGAGVARCNLV